MGERDVVSPRIVVVEHQESCPPALLGDGLTAAGADLAMVRPYAGDRLPEPTAYDALLVLGGDMGAGDDETVPWLEPVRAHVRYAADAGTPVLGICLGHQLVATALGGSVVRNPAGQALGLQPVGWTAAAHDDPLASSVVGAEQVVHWNNDVVASVPAGTGVLATAADGSVQVARFAPSVWGVQAHPEVDVALCRRWAEADREDHLARGVDQQAFLLPIEDAMVDLERSWRPLAERFARLAARSARLAEPAR